MPPEWQPAQPQGGLPLACSQGVPIVRPQPVACSQPWLCAPSEPLAAPRAPAMDSRAPSPEAPGDARLASDAIAWLASAGGRAGGPARLLGGPRRVGRKPKSLSFQAVEQTFDMPIEAAARTLGVCTTVVKKICRANGVVRWPFRKLQSRQARAASRGPAAGAGRPPAGAAGDAAPHDALDRVRAPPPLAAPCAALPAAQAARAGDALGAMEGGRGEAGSGEPRRAGGAADEEGALTLVTPRLGVRCPGLRVSTGAGEAHGFGAAGYGGCGRLLNPSPRALEHAPQLLAMVSGS